VGMRAINVSLFWLLIEPAMFINLKQPI